MPFACSITIRDVSARRSCSFSSSIEATSSSSRATAPSPSARETSRSLGLLSRGPADKPVHPLRERALDAEHPVEACDLEHAEDSWIVGDDHALAAVGAQPLRPPDEGAESERVHEGDAGEVDDQPEAPAADHVVELSLEWPDAGEIELARRGDDEGVGSDLCGADAGGGDGHPARLVPRR